MPRRPIPSAESVWRTYDGIEARLTAPLSERMLELAGVGPGSRVLDLATGRGEPAILAAHRVGPSGSVLGVDVAEGMLNLARQRASREGVTNLELRVMDAASLGGIPQGHFDSVLVRWGLMYMDRPVDALIAARSAMAPRGELVAAVWAEPERVPYFTLPRIVLQKFRSLPEADSTGPGTFRYANPERLRQDLERGGFRIRHSEEFETPVMEARTAGELVEWARAFGMTRLLNDLPEETQQSWEKEFSREAESFRNAGVIRLGGVTRIVVASSADPQAPTR